MFCLTLISCEQNKPTEKLKKEIVKINKEKIYSKIISDSTNKLIDKIEKLEVQYTVWGCECPQWIQTKDLIKRDSTSILLGELGYLVKKEVKTSGTL